MQPDFPAAHSMDTMWFAVDDDGHVAVFESGEAGAVPSDANLGEDYWDVLEEIVAAIPEGQALHELAGGLAPGETTTHLRSGGGPVVLFLKSRAEAAEEIARHDGQPVPGEPGEPVRFEDLPEQAFAALHARGACLGCVYDRVEGDEPDVGRHGVYVYEHLTDNWIAGPYGRRQRPAHPVPLDRLPASVRERLARFQGRFADTPRLQPAEVWPSDAWGASWMALDGSRHAFPGREKEAAEELAEAELPPGEARPETPAAPKKPWWKFW